MGSTLLNVDDFPSWGVADERLTAITAEHANPEVTHHQVDTPLESEREGLADSTTMANFLMALGDGDGVVR